MILLTLIIIVAICMFISYFVFFINIVKLQSRLHKLKTDLPTEYLYLNSMLLSAARVNGKNLIKEIKSGSLSSLEDEEVNMLCNTIISSETLFKFSAIVFISLLISLILLALALSQ